MVTWLRRSVKAWLYVNGPAGAVLVMAQTVGVPERGFYAWGWILMVLLMPGMAIVDKASQVLGLRGMPAWYYAFAWPAIVVTCNLAVYIVAGVGVGWFWIRLDSFLRRYEDRRRTGVHVLTLRD